MDSSNSRKTWSSNRTSNS